MKGDREYREYLEIDGGPDVEIKPYEEAEKLQDEVDVPGIPEVNLDAWAEFGNTEYMFPDRKEPAYPLEEIEKGNIAFVARVAESTEDYETGDPVGFGVLDISVDEDAYAAVDGLEYGTPVEWSDPDVGATASMRALAVAPAFQGYGIATALRGISHALIDEVETELGDQYELVRSTETNYLTTGSQKTHSREGMQAIAFQPLRFNNGEYGETKRGDKVINGEVWMADKTPERLQAADEELLDVAGTLWDAVEADLAEPTVAGIDLDWSVDEYNGRVDAYAEDGEDLEDLERLLENKAARQTTEVWTPVTEWQAQAALGEHDDMVPTGFAVQDGRWHAIYTVVREDMELPPIEIGKGYSGTVQDPETGEKATTIDIAEPNSHVVEIASRLEREELATDWQEVETDG